MNKNSVYSAPKSEFHRTWNLILHFDIPKVPLSIGNNFVKLH